MSVFIASCWQVISRKDRLDNFDFVTDFIKNKKFFKKKSKMGEKVSEDRGSHSKEHFRSAH